VRLPSGFGMPAGVPPTPAEAADAALSAIGPTTEVGTTGAARVAGRDAYELLLSPRDPASLIGQVRLAVDAATHVPLRVDVYPRNATSPALRVAFQQISFGEPDEEQFAFNPPPGTTVTEGTLQDLAGSRPSVIGEDWTSVLVAHLPAAPKTGGRLLAGPLFSIRVTDDGTVYAGAVTPEKLDEVVRRNR
jgi:hypothetical protein